MTGRYTYVAKNRLNGVESKTRAHRAWHCFQHKADARERIGPTQDRFDKNQSVSARNRGEAFDRVFFFFFLSSFELKLIHHGRVVKSDRQEARRRGSTTRCSSFSVQGTVMWGKHTRRGGLWRAKWRRIIVPRRKRSHKSLCVCVCVSRIGTRGEGG